LLWLKDVADNRNIQQRMLDNHPELKNLAKRIFNLPVSLKVLVSFKDVDCVLKKPIASFKHSNLRLKDTYGTISSCLSLTPLKYNVGISFKTRL
jgi:hypothetical protein